MSIPNFDMLKIPTQECPDGERHILLDIAT
jgi:hypothetical protein